jgi:hypothetical protein
MPFGGRYGSCAAVSIVNGTSLEVSGCSGSASTFVINGPTIQTTSNPPLCLDLQFGDLAAGVVGVVPCNYGINQQWFVSGGQIVSANRGDGQDHCLDVRFGDPAFGTPLGVVPCNATDAQEFWLAGFTMKIPSTFFAPAGSPPVPTPECLDVLYDNEVVGATLDDSVCNGGNAQWFVLDTVKRIALANKPSLCVATGPVSNGLAAVSLQTCQGGVDRQRWTFINSGLVDNRRVAAIFNQASACLDVKYADPASPTDVVNFTCNGGVAQRWQPIPKSGYPYVPASACGGSSNLACPAAFEYCQRPANTCATPTTPAPSGTCAIMPVTCSGTLAPVCACDGRTYANDCERQAAGINKWFDGACSSQTCPASPPTPGTSCSQGNITCVYTISGQSCVQRLQCTNGVWSSPTVVCPS